MTPKRRFVFVLAAAAAALATGAAPASATFHLVFVREVYPGSLAAPEAEYVELQMYSAGQSLVHGHTIAVYNAAGTKTGSATFAADAAQSANQSTLLAATPAAEAQFGILADAALSAGSLDPQGGAACWESLDCVAWGSFNGSAFSPVGPPADAGGIPDGMALRRTIAPGCATLLEAGDDSNSSAADFFDAAPAPRPNAVAPTEHACAATGGGEAGRGGGGGSANGGRGAGNPPQTTIRSGPPRISRRRTATFRFAARPPAATFRCSLDRRAFSACRSPHIVRRLRPGRHVFRVEARGAGGLTDHSPAVWTFRVLAKAR